MGFSYSVLTQRVNDLTPRPMVRFYSAQPVLQTRTNTGHQVVTDKAYTKWGDFLAAPLGPAGPHTRECLVWN
jgi:hypothetical protein